MTDRTMTPRQALDLVPGLHCLLEAEGAFAHLDDLLQYRLGICRRNLMAQVREAEVERVRTLSKYVKQRKVPAGVGDDGEPTWETREFVPADDRDQHDEALRRILDEGEITLQAPELRASWLRGEDGRIPTSWFTGLGEAGEDRRITYSPGSLLTALDPILTMDLEDEG